MKPAELKTIAPDGFVEGVIFILRAFTKKFRDDSTETEFSFAFFCDQCGRPWNSVPVPFSRTKNMSWLKKLFGIPSALWKEEHKDAFERANREAMFHFNRCSICKSWVCDHDFSEETNLCSNCHKIKRLIGK